MAEKYEKKYDKEIIESFIAKLKFNEAGLIPAIIQQYDTGEVLMLGWMNHKAVEGTTKTGKAHFWSRSRNKLWQKGETSNQTQNVKKIIADCDNDTLLIMVDQQGVACHTGRRNCFFNEMTENSIKINQDVLVSPEKLYGKPE